MVLDALARQWRFGYSDHPKWKSLIGRHAKLHFLKPQTFMNVSGEAIAACAQFYKIEPAALDKLRNKLKLNAIVHQQHYQLARPAHLKKVKKAG